MVKFGRHSAAVRSGLGPSYYIVPYADLKKCIDVEGKSAASAFKVAWRAQLAASTAWSSDATRRLWARIFSKIAGSSLSRGIPPEEALQLFVHMCEDQASSSASASASAAAATDMVEEVDEESKGDADDDASISSPASLLRHLKRLELANSTNCDVLRKAIKKFDKRKGTATSVELLPELYALTYATGSMQFRAMIQVIAGALSHSKSVSLDAIKEEEGAAAGGGGGGDDDKEDEEDDDDDDNNTSVAAKGDSAPGAAGQPGPAAGGRPKTNRLALHGPLLGKIPAVSLVRLRSRARRIRRQQAKIMDGAGGGSGKPAPASTSAATDSSGSTSHLDGTDTLTSAPEAGAAPSPGSSPTRRGGTGPASGFQAMEAELDRRRREEFLWLHQLSKRFPPDEDPPFLSKLVLHRGFHSGMDGGDRPIENSLTAYESAWSAGLRYCECDIALTVDEYLVLCHDSNFKRLALFDEETSALTARNVGEMTYREIISMPLRSGQRPPLLEDVLESALAIGGGSQLVIEVKKGNPRSASALAQLFQARPELIDAVAVVMSFDLWVIHEFNKFFHAMLETDNFALRGADAYRPQVLLLTVSEETDEAPYLYLSVSEQHQHQQQQQKAKSEGTGEAGEGGDGGVAPQGEGPAKTRSLRTTLESWLVRDASRLDGVYLQFEPEMLEPETGGKSIRALSEQYCIGVWGRVNGADPDDETTARKLMETGADFVNTDLPKSFVAVS